MTIVNALVALPGEPAPVHADLHIRDGRFASVTRRPGFPARHPALERRANDVLDAGGMLILPGAVDPHVHFNDPGYTDREDFLHGTSAAASGGVTTVIDMPCTSIPPVTSAANLETKLHAIAGRAVVDYGLYGGVCGERTDDRGNRHAGTGPRDYHDSRPEPAEMIAVMAAVELARHTGAQLHIVHVSTARAAHLIAEAPNVTGETAPNRERLWHALAHRRLDFVGSDHAPAPVAAKRTGSIWTDYAGIPGTGTLFPYLYSEGYVRGRLSLEQLTAATSPNAARRFGIDDRKGSIEPGKDGDCAIIDPAAEWTVKGDEFLSRGRVTPFEGTTLSGRVVATIVRGTVVYDTKHGIVGAPGYGQLLRSCA